MPAVASPPTESALLADLTINHELVDAIVPAVKKALTMAGLSARCVGVSAIPSRQAGEVTGMIGVNGSVSGFVTVNMSGRLALQAVGGLLGESFDRLTPQVVDGAGELTNIIVGGVKSALCKSDWMINQITVPSVIVGDGYQVAFARGLELLDVLFEVESDEAILVSDRLLHVSLSLLKL